MGWLRSRAVPDVAHHIHGVQLAEHGGTVGVRDEGLIDSALARVVNLASYGQPDGAVLAASYAFGIARNHGFVYGNKRTAWVLARLFLIDNGMRLKFDPGDAIRTMESVADGRLDEAALAQWFRERIVDGSLTE